MRFKHLKGLEYFNVFGPRYLVNPDFVVELASGPFEGMRVVSVEETNPVTGVVKFDLTNGNTWVIDKDFSLRVYRMEFVEELY